ncbi:MAG: hypothetical protein COX07_03120 [Bacteroidetes bacterium CG23_combo_of_CG06-09_8_20_14_all_32_9]|nr:MAG: hypothetical protein COX07_03120 [Bacteroidetes bacterium CG23_combo_of_CG06-09_8_20_14_all_32_9]
MKKIYLTFFAAFMGYLSVNAQIIYSNNFDSYTAGVKVALTAGAPWTTWSNAPGGAEDAVFSTTQFFSPSNSIYIVANNDLVFNIGDKVTGRYELSWQMFVPSAKLGYFNVLADFAGNNSIWAFQAMIYHDSVFVDAGGTTAAKTNFTQNVWHLVKLIIDLDDDFATFYVDANEVISYKWSKGAQGDGTLVKLDAIDFYGWDGTGSPTPVTGTAGYYFDDLKIEQVVAPNAPSNLTAVLNGADIDVAWTAPTPGPAPDGYALSRNGIIVFNTPSAVSYTDISPWPNTYYYVVRANYTGLGYSHASNQDSVTVPGGVTRNLVLMEGGTGTWCPYCPGAAMGLRDLIEVNNKSAVAIEYHDGDSYANIFSSDRIGYYAIDAFPTMICDGKLRLEGGNATISMYPYYLPMYNERYITPSLHIININIVQDSVDYFTATITIEQTFQYASGWKLHTALTESNIPETWGNQTEVDFACRGMYPDAYGTTLDFSVSDTQTVILNFSTAGFVKNNCEFITFVQHSSSKEVTQVAKIDMSSILGIQELNGDKVSIYPNPASDYMMLLSDGKGTMSICDLTGKIVYSSKITNNTQVIDISKLSKGIYVVKVNSTKSSFAKKLVVE